jgi:hypothetical protein
MAKCVGKIAKKPASLTVAGCQVYLVTYTHRHGVDSWICATAEGAWESAADLCLESVREFDQKDQNRIKATYKRRDYTWAVLLYLGLRTDEDIEISQREIQP